MAAALTVSRQVEQHLGLEAKLRRELGELSLRLLAEEDVEDILRRPASLPWLKPRGAGFSRLKTRSPVTAVSALGTVANLCGTVLNQDHTVLTELPLDGIRLWPRRVFTLNDYESTLTAKEDIASHMRQQQKLAPAVRGMRRAEIIRTALRAHKYIMMVGATGSDKMIFRNAILDAIAEVIGRNRAISFEDFIERQCRIRKHLGIPAAAVTTLKCLRASMRSTSTRVVVGEVRGTEPQRLWKAWHTDRPRGLKTVYRDGRFARPHTFERPGRGRHRRSAEEVDRRDRRSRIFVESEFTLEAGYEVREMLLAIALEKSQYQVRQASGLPVVNVRAALRSYFFTNKCSVGPQDDYLGRTVKKARASIDRGGGDD
jgi:type IV secretion system protein TrbB